jgi:hypothetical protein
MKALTVAIALLTASTALAQNEAQKAAEPQQATELRRGPPPGRPMPQPQPPPPPPSRSLAAVDREELSARLARLEKLLEEVEDRMDHRSEGRNKLRRAQETLDSVQQFVAEAPPVGAIYPTPSPAPQPPPPPPAPVVRPMPDGPFKRLNEAVAKESFAEDKMRVLTMAAGDNYFLISQVAQLLNHFSFSQDKLNVVRSLKPRILDPENGYTLYSAFSFSSDKKRLQEILAQR